MFYTLLVLFLWLTHGTPSIAIGFTPWAIAFIIAIIIDLIVYKPWTKVQ